MEITVLIEVPMGSRNKYGMDHRLGRLRLGRTLFTATRYPADYGYVPKTLAEDGDPLDALVLTGGPTRWSRTSRARCAAGNRVPRPSGCSTTRSNASNFGMTRPAWAEREGRSATATTGAT